MAACKAEGSIANCGLVLCARARLIASTRAPSIGWCLVPPLFVPPKARMHVLLSKIVHICSGFKQANNSKLCGWLVLANWPEQQGLDKKFGG